jgi:hypothetical protein
MKIGEKKEQRETEEGTIKIWDEQRVEEYRRRLEKSQI